MVFQIEYKSQRLITTLSQISLTAVLSKIETFKANMAAKYDHLIDERIPLQKCAKVIKSLLISRLHIMVLHRYHNSVVSSMPDRLRNIMLASGTITLEMSVTLDTHPELRHWAWYSGALQQYHTAFLLLLEVSSYPCRLPKLNLNYPSGLCLPCA